MRLYRRPHLKFLNVIFTNADFLSVYTWVVIFSYLGGNSIFVVLDKINSSPDLKDMGKCQMIGEGNTLWNFSDIFLFLLTGQEIAPIKLPSPL